ncbi:diol dehydratase small subunit [Clostridium fallax]|uniref:Glycerol dehydratase, cobalamin-dependent, gamma subunit n=1 Tax=Clostridium fallax TaxID=1533 RepID=A0A1M4Y5G7_9CLOT|nr:diol dehydratase small subunit [Clostridium fallax]SHF00823.1 glycerol dehydratase, cobalamin-dependent, gamma subunit [Clostridium fallax]SQB07478.1 coenzyme B12-dependent glycerol dehydratase, small subunit [Clostridium fallax]
MEQRRMNPKDYPLATKRPESIKTPTGMSLQDITLEKVLSGEVKPEDVRISPETLEMQAQIAEGMNRDAIARNFRRAAELIKVPDDRILEIYNALRPYRSTKEELLAIAEELETVYGAKVNASFVREAVEVYEQRKKLREE